MCARVCEGGAVNQRSGPARTCVIACDSDLRAI